MKKGYIDAAKTIREASEKQISVGEHVEQMWGITGQTERITDKLLSKISLPSFFRYLEIGPGTGRFLRELQIRFPNIECEIYETDKHWSKWVSQKYKTKECEANGVSLGITKSNTIDFCAAHGVFVYLDTIVAFSYLQEIGRCLKEGGYLIFNIINMDDKCILNYIEKSIKAKSFYLIPISKKVIDKFLRKSNCIFLDSFIEKYDRVNSTYLVYQKQT